LVTDSDAGTRRPVNSLRLTVQVTVTATDPPGVNWAVSVFTLSWVSECHHFQLSTITP
jgi:hypothetical protein